MPIANWIVLSLIGRLFIYLWQKLYLPDFVNKVKFIVELHGCDLCSGVYIYTILAFLFGFDILKDIGFIHIPFVSSLITGGILSFIMHLLVLGWKSKFEVIVL